MRILFLEDEGVVRAGVTHIMRKFFPEAEIIDVGFGEEALDHLSKSNFDILLTDLELKSNTNRTLINKSLHGVHIIRVCAEAQPNCKIIVLTGYSGVAQVMTMVKLGVHGFLFKESSGDLIKPCIEAVLQDKIYYTDQVIKIIEQNKGNASIPSIILKKEENEVLLLLKDGYSTKEISSKLKIKQRQVHYILDKLYKKTNTQKNTELLAFSYQNTVIVDI